MRYSFLSAAVLALTSSVFAQNPTSGFDPITAPTQDQQIPAGSTFQITWEPSTNYTGSVTITLLQGASPSTLALGDKVGSVDSSAGKFPFTVPTTASFATYGFKLSLDSDPTIFQYSFPFHISGGSSSATGSATSTMTMTLSPGPSYTTTSSSTVTLAPTANSTSTTSHSTTSANSTIVTSTTAKSTTTAPATKTTGAASSTTSAPATSSSSAAGGNIATAGMAVFGGLVMAFAL